MHITASVFINDDESGLHQNYEVWLEKLAPEKDGKRQKGLYYDYWTVITQIPKFRPKREHGQLILAKLRVHILLMMEGGLNTGRYKLIGVSDEYPFQQG